MNVLQMAAETPLFYHPAVWWIGLANVSRRLVLCYGPAAALRIASDPSGEIVGFVVPCEFTVTKR